MGRHRKFDASFKAKVAIAALQEKESLNSLATKYGLSPTVIQQWREELEQQAGKVFETPQEDKRELKQLKAQNERLLHKVGQLTIDCDFFAQACEDAGLKVR
ncbi:MAG: transposase [Lachnospira sp.]